MVGNWTTPAGGDASRNRDDLDLAPPGAGSCDRHGSRSCPSNWYVGSSPRAAERARADRRSVRSQSSTRPDRRQPDGPRAARCRRQVTAPDAAPVRAASRRRRTARATREQRSSRLHVDSMPSGIPIWPPKRIPQSAASARTTRAPPHRSFAPAPSGSALSCSRAPAALGAGLARRRGSSRAAHHAARTPCPAAR